MDLNCGLKFVNISCKKCVCVLILAKRRFLENRGRNSILVRQFRLLFHLTVFANSERIWTGETYLLLYRLNLREYGNVYHSSGRMTLRHYPRVTVRLLFFNVRISISSPSN